MSARAYNLEFPDLRMFPLGSVWDPVEGLQRVWVDPASSAAPEWPIEDGQMTPDALLYEPEAWNRWGGLWRGMLRAHTGWALWNRWGTSRVFLVASPLYIFPPTTPPPRRRSWIL